MKQHVCWEEYIWNLSLYSGECNEICEIDKYLNNCTYAKQAVENLFKDEMPNTTGDTSSSKNLYDLFFSVDFIANYNYFLMYVKCCNETKFMFLKA